MPFAVADSLAARGIAPVLFALRGACDPGGVERFRHHWISVGQLGRATKLFRSEGCRDLIFIGTLLRPVTTFVVVISGIRSFQVFDTVHVLTKGGPSKSTEVLIHSMYTEGFEFFRSGYGAALTVVFLTFILLLTLIKSRLADRGVNIACLASSIAMDQGGAGWLDRAHRPGRRRHPGRGRGAVTTSRCGDSQARA